MLTVACVWVGNRYGREYVEALRNMVARHLPLPHRFVCLTDRDEHLPGVVMVDVAHYGLPGWWTKLLVLDPDLRGPGRCLYFDLDTVIVGSLEPLARWDGEFGICRNFTQLAGHPDWPCRYGSCVMSIAEGFGRDIARAFLTDAKRIMERCPRGDQQAIEMLYPHATFLQDVLPPRYFVGRRDFSDQRPPGAAVMVFAGRTKPHNTPIRWLRQEWEGACAS